MGEIRVPVTVRALGGKGESFTADFLVDTGATDCVAPSNRLQAVGVQPEEKREYELADGSVRELECAWVKMEMMGRTSVARVVFGPDQVEPSIGHLLLQGVGAKIDPTTHSIQLKRALRL